MSVEKRGAEAATARAEEELRASQAQCAAARRHAHAHVHMHMYMACRGGAAREPSPVRRQPAASLTRGLPTY